MLEPVLEMTPRCRCQAPAELCRCLAPPILVASIVLAAAVFMGRAGVARAAADDEGFAAGARAFHDEAYETAVIQLTRFLELSPHSPNTTEARLLLGRADFELGQYPDALIELRQALGPEGSPHTADILYWLGEALLKNGDPEVARQHFQQVLDQFPASSYAPFARFSIAWSYWQAGRWEEALPEFQAVVDQFPDDPLRIEAQCRAGECLVRLNRPADAVETLETFVTSYPVTHAAPQAYYLLAEAQMGLRHYDAAIDAYRKSVGLAHHGPWAPYALSGVGLAAFAQHQDAASAAAFDDYLEHYPRGPQHDQVRFYLGRALLALNRPAEAVDTWGQLVQHAPSSPWADDALLWQGETWYTQGRFANAAASFQRLVDHYPASDLLPDALYALGWTQQQMGALDDAFRTFERVAAQDPHPRQRASALLQTADLLMRAGDYAPAAARYDQLLTDYHESPYADYAQYQLGRALMAQGHPDAAALACDALTNRFPHSPLRDRAQRLAVQARRQPRKEMT